MPDQSLPHQYVSSRILLLLTVAVILPQLSLASLLLTILVMLAVYAVAPIPIQEWSQSLWRFKWLLLSIVIACLWVTAGEPVYRNEFVTLPSKQAFHLAGERLLLIVSLIGLVRLCLFELPAPLLVAGFRRLATPITMLNINVDKAARRAALTLEYLKHSVTPSIASTTGTEPTNIKSRLDNLAVGFASHWQTIEQAEPIDFPEVNVQKESLLAVVLIPVAAVVTIALCAELLVPLVNEWVA